MSIYINSVCKYATEIQIKKSIFYDQIDVRVEGSGILVIVCWYPMKPEDRNEL